MADAELARQLAAPVKVDIPEWGGEVSIRRANLGDIQAASKLLGDGDQYDAGLLVLARCIVEPDLGDDGFDILKGSPTSVINPLLHAMNGHSGFTAESPKSGADPDDDG